MSTREFVGNDKNVLLEASCLKTAIAMFHNTLSCILQIGKFAHRNTTDVSIVINIGHSVAYSVICLDEYLQRTTLRIF